MIVKAGILAMEKITMRFGGRNLSLRCCYEYLVYNDNFGCTVGGFFVIVINLKLEENQMLTADSAIVQQQLKLKMTS